MARITPNPSAFSLLSLQLCPLTYSTHAHHREEAGKLPILGHQQHVAQSRPENGKIYHVQTLT